MKVERVMAKMEEKKEKEVELVKAGTEEMWTTKIKKVREFIEVVGEKVNKKGAGKEGNRGEEREAGEAEKGGVGREVEDRDEESDSVLREWNRRQQRERKSREKRKT